jgi:hypothetical protein
VVLTHSPDWKARRRYIRYTILHGHGQSNRARGCTNFQGIKLKNPVPDKIWCHLVAP